MIFFIMSSRLLKTIITPFGSVQLDKIDFNNSCLYHLPRHGRGHYRLPDGDVCTIHTKPGEASRGHYISSSTFSIKGRRILIEKSKKVFNDVIVNALKR